MIGVPNGRTIRKRLMRGRRRVLWGRRAFVTVRVPWVAFPSRPPAFEWREFGEALGGGVWQRGDTFTCVSRIYGNVQYAEHAAHFADEDGYWEGIQYRIDGDGKMVDARDLDECVVAQWRDRETWYDRHAHGMEGRTGAPVVDALFAAAAYAKTTYHNETPDGLLWTFSVKWFYPRSMRAFCRALRRAFLVARRERVGMRLCR